MTASTTSSGLPTCRHSTSSWRRSWTGTALAPTPPSTSCSRDGVDRRHRGRSPTPVGRGNPGAPPASSACGPSPPTAARSPAPSSVCPTLTGITYGRDELHQRATFDSSPGATIGPRPWRRSRRMLAGAEDGCRPAVIFVDLDRLEELNNGQGHDAGDEFLAVVARRLRGAVREDDLVGRIGGDKFLVVCPAIGTAAEAVRTAIRSPNRSATRSSSRASRSSRGRASAWPGRAVRPRCRDVGGPSRCRHARIEAAGCGPTGAVFAVTAAGATPAGLSASPKGASPKGRRPGPVVGARSVDLGHRITHLVGLALARRCAAAGPARGTRSRW